MTLQHSGRLKSMRSICGFTLLELLVVMTLLSLLMTGLISAFRTMAQTESKIDQRLARLDELRVARGFLQQTISRVSAESLDQQGASGDLIVPFFAGSDSLVWIGVMPGRPNVGGRFYFRLAIEDFDMGRQLVLRYQACDLDMTVPDWQNADSRILIGGIVKFEVQAEGLPPKGHRAERSWPLGWQIGWPISDALPERIKLKLADLYMHEFEWVIQVYPLPEIDSSFNEVVV